MFTIRKPKENGNKVPIRQATNAEFLNYKNNCNTDIDSEQEKYEKLLMHLADHQRRIESLEKSASNPVNDKATKICFVHLFANAWSGSASPYAQVVDIAEATEKSQIDLLPNVEQLAAFYEKDLTFVTENSSGTITVYAIGQKPENDYTIQAAITEVL